MNVLVIPEDFRKDQYILKPILQALLRASGRPNAKLQICQDPLLAGVDQALRWERIAEVLEMYPMVDLFLLIVDRDGVSTRRGHSVQWRWKKVRADCDPKERYFFPLARQRGLTHEPGDGRKTLAMEAATRYPRIRTLCPEIKELESRVKRSS